MPNFTTFGSDPITADYGAFTDILGARYGAGPGDTFVYSDDDVGGAAAPAAGDFALTGLYDVSPGTRKFIVLRQTLHINLDDLDSPVQQIVTLASATEMKHPNATEGVLEVVLDPRTTVVAQKRPGSWLSIVSSVGGLGTVLVSVLAVLHGPFIKASMGPAWTPRAREQLRFVDAGEASSTSLKSGIEMTGMTGNPGLLGGGGGGGGSTDEINSQQ